MVLLLGAVVGCHCSVLWLGGKVDDQLWGSGRGAIAGCHCSVLWLGEGDGHFGGVDEVAIAGCHCSVLWLGEGDGQLWGEWTWCHCWVPLQGAIVVCYGWGRVTANFWGSGRGAIGGCHCSVLWSGASVTNFGGVDVQGPYTAMACRKSIQKNCLKLLAALHCSLYIDTTKIGFCYLGSMLV